MDASAGTALEQPILWLGLVGFDPHQRARLEAVLAESAAGRPVWRTCPIGEADAWCVNGAQVRVLPDGNLRVAAGLPTERALNLDMGEVARPVAFSTPLGSPDFEPRCTFDPASAGSVHECLHQLERGLRSLRAQFVLGAQIVARGQDLQREVFHLSRKGSLLAILDFLHGNVALSPHAQPADLWEAEWEKRPPSASYVPAGFEACRPNELAWTYAHRSANDLLPPQYRTRTVFFRQAPRVPLRWLNDAQLVLLRELSVEPGDMQQLARRTGLPLARLARDLTCLYYAGSITTSRVRAADPAATRPDRTDNPPSRNAGSEADSLLSDGYPGLRSQSPYDPTAPAALEHKPKAR